MYFPFDITFIVDTGASQTQLNWNDAQSTGFFFNIRFPFMMVSDGTYRGIGGDVGARKIAGINITFNSNIGKHTEELDWLSISNEYTVDGRKIPPMNSLLGIDILQRFDILFESKFAHLRKK